MRFKLYSWSYQYFTFDFNYFLTISKLLYKKIIPFLSCITFIIGCSDIDSDIEKTTINGSTYYVIDSKEDLLWLSNPELLKLKPGIASTQQNFNTEKKWSANYIQNENKFNTTFSNSFVQ